MMKLKFFSKLLDKRIAAYQRELIETHYKEVDNMYRQMRGWRHDCQEPKYPGADRCPYPGQTENE